MALAGSLAVALHAPERAGKARSIELMAEGLDAVPPAFARDFLLAHVHLSGGSRPGLRAIDPSTGVRVDVLPDAQRVVRRAHTFRMAGQRARVLAPEDLLDHELRVLAGAREDSPVDVQHWFDAVALAELCRRPAPPRPEHAGEVLFSRLVDAPCARCSLDPRFPLAARRALSEALDSRRTLV